MAHGRKLWGVGLLAGLSLAILWHVPLSWIDHGPNLCLVKAISGKECPGCGLTRAFFHLLHGEWRTALAFNWRCMVVFPILALVTFRNIINPTSKSILWIARGWQNKSKK